MINRSNQTSGQVKMSFDEIDAYIKQVLEFVAVKTVDMIALALLCGIAYMLFIGIRRFFRKRLDS